ncbi:hypothetical protein [Ancylobacter sp.]|uniref:hypothetical protein n=1 Tax=Ancylobacter sp. TaxID=1872567 RepID=UPI003D0AFEE8
MRSRATVLALAFLVGVLAPLAGKAQEQRADAMPPPAVLLALLRGTMIALNQANVTGNYSVLRDLAAPSFRDANSSASLADRFRIWREGKLDFAAVALLDVKLSGAPTIGTDGLLRLSGYFPTAPLRIGFDVAFEPVNGHWRLGAIKAEPLEPEATGAVADAAPAKTTSSAAAPAKSVLPELPTAASLGIPMPPGDRPRG